MLRILLALLLLAVAAPAAAAQESSSNVERVAQLPEAAGAISLNFIGDTMFVSTINGILSYDVSDPASPRPLGVLPMQIWENEDVDVDRRRERLFVARDPRQLPGVPSGTFETGAVIVVDVSNPQAMAPVATFTLPAGHTTTCINDCDYLWTGGPLATAGQAAQGWTGRPIHAHDVRDLSNITACPDLIDTGRDDGVTAYAHDVQVDEQGVAWVSGQGGVRGYRTSGRHRDPLTGQVEEATGCEPIAYAGSGTPEAATPSRFMHNAWRETYTATGPARTIPGRKACGKRTKKARKRCRRRCAELRRKGRRPKRCRARKPRVVAPAETRREILFGTEENIVGDCATSGRFATYDLAGTFDGEGFRNPEAKHRMRVLDTFTPEGQEGSTGCASAHYFHHRGDGVFANAFYEQGVRFLDLTDPADIRQIGWYRPADANAFAASWHEGHVFVSDVTRGIDVLAFGGGAGSREVRAPVRTARPGMRFDRRYFGGLCPLPG